ncbi:hypothetical protein D3C73_1362500 [compost metagenome]
MAAEEFSKLAPVYAGYTLGALQFDGGRTAEADKSVEQTEVTDSQLVKEPQHA